MLIIKKEKLDEVVEKYQMIIHKNTYGYNYYNFGKSFTIYPSAGNLEIRMSGTHGNLDLLYDLIQMGAVEKTSPELNRHNWVALQKRIAELEKELEVERKKNKEKK